MTASSKPPTPHIRWEQPVYSFFGYIGNADSSKDPHVFLLHCPEEGDDGWTLKCHLSGMLDKHASNTDPEELKAEAERWLYEFVVSLGAVFGDAVAADLRSRAEELAAVVDRRPGAERDKLQFAAGLKRAADLIEHGDQPAVNDEPAKETGQ